MPRGHAAGMASGVRTDQDGLVELISMYVTPLGRGRGVGDHLVQAVERWARLVGAQTLRLGVVEGNEHAWALYQRNGFRDTGELGDLMPDGVRRERFMVKEIEGTPSKGFTEGRAGVSAWFALGGTASWQARRHAPDGQQ